MILKALEGNLTLSTTQQESWGFILALVVVMAELSSKDLILAGEQGGHLFQLYPTLGSTPAHLSPFLLLVKQHR